MKRPSPIPTLDSYPIPVNFQLRARWEMMRAVLQKTKRIHEAELGEPIVVHANWDRDEFHFDYPPAVLYTFSERGRFAVTETRWGTGWTIWYLRDGRIAFARNDSGEGEDIPPAAFGKALTLEPRGDVELN